MCGGSVHACSTLHERIVHARSLVLLGRSNAEDTGGLLAEDGHLHALCHGVSLGPDHVPECQDGTVLLSRLLLY